MTLGELQVVIYDVLREIFPSASIPMMLSSTLAPLMLKLIERAHDEGREELAKELREAHEEYVKQLAKNIKEESEL
jgi:hypothetical protein